MRVASAGDVCPYTLLQCNTALVLRQYYLAYFLLESLLQLRLVEQHRGLVAQVTH